MIILGIDPGTATTGYGVIEAKDGKLSLIDFGWVSTEKDELPGKRLQFIYKQISHLLKSHNPEIVAMERLFFFNNAKTVMRVSEAMGVMKLAISKKKIEVVDYAPLQVKSVVGGNGKAKKTDMKAAVRKFLGIRSPKKKKTHFDDVCDALAIAICHAKKTFENLDIAKSGKVGKGVSKAGRR